MKQTISDHALRRGTSLPTRGVKSKGQKYMRIQRLQPLFENGRIHVRREQADFLEEYDLYPNVEHDDQLDALDMAVSVFGTGNVLYGSDKPRNIGDMKGGLSRVDALPGDVG